MAYKEFAGKTIEEAKAAACEELGVSAEELVYEVIEEKGGFLGLFKNQKIRVSINEEKEETPAEEAESIVEEVKEVLTQSDITAASGETPSEVAVDFICKILKEMDLSAEITATVNEEDENIYINIEGEDMGTLIGKRGQTLDALQYLTSLVVNRACGQYFKIKLDTENYRERRKETLENLAKNIAMKVKKTHRSVALEPMNPYERRIIHAALQNDKYVETHSEGEEPYRKVIVSMKKGVTYDSGRYGSGYGRGSYGRGGYGRGGYGRGGSRYGNNRGGNRPQKRYSDENSNDYSKDYMKDYAAYKEAKAAEKAKAEENNQ